MVVGEGELPTLKITSRKKKVTVYYLDCEKNVWYVVVLKEVI